MSPPGIVKLTKTRLTDPQDDGLEPVVNPACWGAVSPIRLNLTIPFNDLIGVDEKFALAEQFGEKA